MRLSTQTLSSSCAQQRLAEFNTLLEAGAITREFPSRIAIGALVCFVSVDEHGALNSSIAAQYVSSRSEEHTSALQSLLRISYAISCLNKKNRSTDQNTTLI